MRNKKIKLPLEGVKALLEQGLYLHDIARVSGYSKPELCTMSKLWGLRRKRGPKPGWKKANANL
jgi:hypothetical protein